MSNITITLNINADTLRSVTDEYLHGLWHVAQINPAPFGDRDASELVGSITAEIVRRWLKAAPVERFNRAPTAHHWVTLVQHGSWRGPGGTWLPYDAAHPMPAEKADFAARMSGPAGTSASTQTPNTGA